jgi:hypothetical protein
MGFDEIKTGLGLLLSTIFSDLPPPAEAGFAKAGNRYPLFGITL